jgi:hypothetical protein
MSKEMAGTPKYANRPGLPPLSPEAKQKMQEQKDAAAEKEREKAKKAAKKAQGAADDNKKSDKVCQAM